MASRFLVALAFVVALLTLPYTLTAIFPDDRNDFAVAHFEEF